MLSLFTHSLYNQKILLLQWKQKSHALCYWPTFTLFLLHTIFNFNRITARSNYYLFMFQFQFFSLLYHYCAALAMQNIAVWSFVPLHNDDVMASITNNIHNIKQNHRQVNDINYTAFMTGVPLNLWGSTNTSTWTWIWMTDLGLGSHT